jgi:hypothetical protein
MIKNPLHTVQPDEIKLHGIFRGVVEDNSGDPLGAGRCRIRVFGVHTPEKELDEDEQYGIPTDELPWAEPAGPVAGGGISGFGMSSTPLQGSHVFLFFENGHPLRPIYFASAPNAGGGRSLADPSKGFNDPAGQFPKPEKVNKPDYSGLGRNLDADDLDNTTFQHRLNSMETAAIETSQQSSSTLPPVLPKQGLFPDPVDDPNDPSGSGSTGSDPASSTFPNPNDYSNAIDYWNDLKKVMDIPDTYTIPSSIDASGVLISATKGPFNSPVQMNDIGLNGKIRVSPMAVPEIVFPANTKVPDVTFNFNDPRNDWWESDQVVAFFPTGGLVKMPAPVLLWLYVTPPTSPAYTKKVNKSGKVVKSLPTSFENTIKSTFQGSKNVWLESPPKNTAQYPHNMVLATHGGMSIEIDSTPNKERFSFYHSSNTYNEVDHMGNVARKAAGDVSEIVKGNIAKACQGSEYNTINKDLFNLVKQNQTNNVTGNLKSQIGQNCESLVKGNLRTLVEQRAMIMASKELGLGSSESLSFSGMFININCGMSATTLMNTLSSGGKITQGTSGSGTPSGGSGSSGSGSGGGFVGSANIVSGGLPISNGIYLGIPDNEAGLVQWNFGVDDPIIPDGTNGQGNLGGWSPNAKYKGFTSSKPFYCWPQGRNIPTVMYNGILIDSVNPELQNFINSPPKSSPYYFSDQVPMANWMSPLAAAYRFCFIPLSKGQDIYELAIQRLEDWLLNSKLGFVMDNYAKLVRGNAASGFFDILANMEPRYSPYIATWKSGN